MLLFKFGLKESKNIYSPQFAKPPVISDISRRSSTMKAEDLTSIFTHAITFQAVGPDVTVVGMSLALTHFAQSCP